MAGGHIRVNWLKPRAPIYAYTEHAQFVDVAEVDNARHTVGAVNTFHEGQGM